MKPTVGMQSLAISFLVLTINFAAAAQSPSLIQRPTIRWRDCLKQQPDWYASKEAARIAENLLLYQRESGGWPKNIEMAAVLNEKQKGELAAQQKTSDATIDNQSTYPQLTYLARVFGATGNNRFKEPFIRGLDYLLAAQYQNGGWPQFYPYPSGYQKHITFNDDAMIGVMTLLRAIAGREPAYAFIDESRRVRCGQAMAKGIKCILRCQVRVDGKLTVWCAQHDEVTFLPAAARTYEKISLSGSESVSIVRFLMGIEHPNRAVSEAINGAVVWFKAVRLTGIKVVAKADATLARGFDRVVIADPAAAPLWARFYEIGTNRPIFCGRDGVLKGSLAEIEYERRTGYRWYVSEPAELLANDYPAWLKKTVSSKQ